MKAFAIFPVALFAIPVHAGNLVGTVVPPYPAGLDSKQGTCVSGGAGYEHLCDYAFGILEDENGKLLMILGQKHVPGSENPVRWLVTDAIAYPAVAEDQYLARGACEVNGEPDDSVIAIVQVVDAESFNKALWARRLDRETGKFVDLSPTGVRCVNEGWGAD